MTQPLARLKIVITRPREQASQLAQRIEQAGAVPILFPLLDIAAIQDSRILNEQISRLGEFDYAIFISPNAVKYGIAAIRSAGKLPQKLKIVAVGQGSSKALRALGIADVIAPTERFDSEGLLALPELQNVVGQRVIIFRGDAGRELLGDTLKERGAILEYAACYQRSKPKQNASDLLDARPDVITVTSSEALGYLWEMLDSDTRQTIRHTPLFVPHPRIADLARQQGWQHVHLTGSGDDGLITALETWAQEKI